MFRWFCALPDDTAVRVRPDAKQPTAGGGRPNASYLRFVAYRGAVTKGALLPPGAPASRKADLKNDLSKGVITVPYDPARFPESLLRATPAVAATSAAPHGLPPGVLPQFAHLHDI